VPLRNYSLTHVTPLFIAAQNGHTEVVKLLLAYKGDVNASKHTNGVTPLFIAAQNGRTVIVKLLLANKADVNASRHTNDVTPLYIAAQNGRTVIVKLLLANKADVNASRHTDGYAVDSLFVSYGDHFVLHSTTTDFALVDRRSNSDDKETTPHDLNWVSVQQWTYAVRVSSI